MSFRPASRASVTIPLVALVLSACGADGSPPASTGSSSTGSSSTDPTPTQTTSSSPTPPTDGQEDQMQLEITIGDQQFTADLRDSAANRDLLAQLPVTLEMSDHGGVEKTGRLPSRLSLDGQPSGADPDVGDVGYYAPGNDLVLYYGDQSYYEGIVVLGRLQGDAAERIADMDGTVRVQVEGR
ncbi:hypothetical protein ASG49_00430 [Marmoricola sp. Leaf446]|nr:hypothetical protein ASG49_00430 [Marmoricola sp. Leaf446]